MRLTAPKSLVTKSLSIAVATTLAMTTSPSNAQDGAAEAPATPVPATEAPTEAPATEAPATEAPATVAGKPETLDQRVAYFFGTNVGQHLRDNVGLKTIDYDIFLAGLKDVLEGGELKLTEEEMRAAVNEYQQKAAERAVAKGKAFIDEHTKKEGVNRTESGLLYEVIKAAEGPKPGPTDTVSVHYTGTLTNGKKFDSSLDRGEPTEFPVNRVIPGWTEGLQLMSVGSKYRFVIPSELAYGEAGAGRDIGPNETLVFEVELLEIKK